MSEKQEITNSFTDGMVSDYDANKQRGSTYVYSLGGRVVWNSEQGTLSWEVTKGEIAVLNIPQLYTYLGCCEINSKLVVFLASSAGESEIGIVTQDQYNVYNYTTFFNDNLDPYGQRLNFDIRYPIEAQGIVETENIERVYFGDDYNEDRSVNILANPADISVHGCSEMPDLTWGLIKFVKNIPGNLTAGKRQYCYQYIHKSGYESPWSAPCDKIFLTSQQVNHFDWAQYQMSNTGAQTSKGHQLEFKMLDTRFERIRVACILWETDAGPKEASIIYDSVIDKNTGVAIVQHVENTGTIITLELLTQRYFEVEHSKTRLIKENNLHKANVKFRQLVEFDTSEITAIPFLRKMKSDELTATSVAPLTNQEPKQTSVLKNLFDGHIEEYIIDSADNATQNGDYINFKGTQWEHLFKPYWRGSVVPFSLLFWNAKGQPEFALPLFDFTFPEQWNDQYQIKRKTGTITGATGLDYSLTDYSPGSTDVICDGTSFGTPVLQGNDFVLKLLGIKFSNIDLTDILYDPATGRQLISGFSIIRTERMRDIIMQGLLLNTIMEIQGSPAGTPYDTPKVQPLHSSGNGYIDNTLIFGGKEYFSFDISRLPYHGINTSGGQFAVGKIFTFEAPDFFINPAILGEQTTHYLRVVGNCQAAYHDDTYGPAPLSGNHGHFYTKNYHTYYQTGIYWWNAQPDLGAVGYEQFTYWGYEKQVNEMVKPLYIEPSQSIENGYYLISNSHAFLNNYYPPLSSASIDFQARGHQNAIYLSTDIVNMGSRATPWAGIAGENNVSYFIVNYRTGLENYVLDDNLLANRLYQDIGHFIPINAQTIAEATQPNGRVVFNNVEVWGGDCYLDYISYCRLLPLFGECETPTKDYSIGLCFPFESNYNHAMRSGIQYSKDGSLPEATVCGASVNTEQWRNGIFAKDSDPSLVRLEDFNVSRVFVYPDVDVSVRKYNSKTLDYVENRNFPLLEMVSNDKILGERFDSFRKFRINRFQYAEGQYNAIVKLEKLGSNIYCLQQNGLSLLRYNQRELLSTESGNIATGTAQGYGGHDFISIYGTQHQWSVVNNGKSLYYVDAEKGKHIRFGQDGVNPISDIYGQHNFFTEETRNYWKRPQFTWDDNENFFDSPLYYGGIVSTWDGKNDSVITTFSNGIAGYIGTEPKTIEYNEATNQYKTFHPYTPGFYFKYKLNFLSQYGGFLWAHDEGTRGTVYSAPYTSRLRFVVNPMFPKEKVYDNAQLIVNQLGAPLIAQLIMETQSQSQNIQFSTDNRARFREDKLTFPLMQINQTNRLRGEYLNLDYYINNDGTGTLVRISGQATSVRLSNRL